MSGYLIERGNCRPVQFDLADRCSAVRELLRPKEVLHLWSSSDTRGPSAPIVDQVEQYFSSMFATRALQYVHDPMHVDCWCSPARTLDRGFGDCDDLAILAAAVLKAGGIDASVVIGNIGGGTASNHAWVEGIDQFGRGFFYEATNPVLWYGARPLSYVPHALVNEDECVDLRPRRRPVDWKRLLGQGAIVVGAGMIAAALISDE